MHDHDKMPRQGPLLLRRSSRTRPASSAASLLLLLLSGLGGLQLVH